MEHGKMHSGKSLGRYHSLELGTIISLTVQEKSEGLRNKTPHNSVVPSLARENAQDSTTLLSLENLW